MSSASRHNKEELDKNLKEKHDDPDKLLLVHKRTGEFVEVAEIINEDTEVIRAKSQEAIRSKLYFYVVMQAREKELACTLGSDAFRVLGYLRSCIYLNNKVHNVANVDISKALDMSYAKVGRAVKELIVKKVVHFKREKRNPTYYIDPSLCFKGSFYKQQKMMNEYAQLFETENL